MISCNTCHKATLEENLTEIGLGSGVYECETCWKDLVECPRHNGSFDCTPFCEVCEGEQEYCPADFLPCIVPDCQEELTKDIWLEEAGLCVEHSHAYYDHKLDPLTLERIAEEHPRKANQ